MFEAMGLIMMFVVICAGLWLVAYDWYKVQ